MELEKEILELEELLMKLKLGEKKVSIKVLEKEDTYEISSLDEVIKENDIELELDENASQEERSKLLLEFQQRYSIYLNLWKKR
jgi:hypothetical protein